MDVPLEELHALGEDECWQLVAQRRLGRLGVTVAGVPEVFPVNYTPHDQRLLFRSGPGVKLDAALSGTSCFEVDDFDEASGTGWSVMFHGRVAEVPAGPEGDALREPAIHPAAPGVRPLLLVFTPASVSGRRFSWGAIVAPFYR